MAIFLCRVPFSCSHRFFFFNDTATTEIYTLSLHDALPISFGFIDEALASLGRTRQVVLTVNQFFTAGRVVMNSNLLTILPRHFVPVTGMEIGRASCRERV